MKLAREALLLSALVVATASEAAPPLGPMPPGEDAPPTLPDERTLAYRFDAELGWFPKANNRVTYTGSRRFHIAHNEMGFRDKPHAEKKTRPRLMFVGDSFVWGYDVEEGERFTDLLQDQLEAIEVLNLGVSGYGTDQCYLLLQKFFDRYDPDAVVYMFSGTDIEDNRVNFNYGAYYKPYYVVTDAGLELRGVPVPRSSVWSRLLESVIGYGWHPRFTNEEDVTPNLISAMEAFVKSKGASFAVGLIDEHPLVRRHLLQQEIVFFDLTHVDQRYRYPDHGLHWTPEGHRLVAKAVHAFLLHNSISRDP